MKLKQFKQENTVSDMKKEIVFHFFKNVRNRERLIDKKGEGAKLLPHHYSKNSCLFLALNYKILP